MGCNGQCTFQFRQKPSKSLNIHGNLLEMIQYDPFMTFMLVHVEEKPSPTTPESKCTVSQIEPHKYLIWLQMYTNMLCISSIENRWKWSASLNLTPSFEGRRNINTQCRQSFCCLRPSSREVRQNGKPKHLQQLPKDEALDKNGAFAFCTMVSWTKRRKWVDTFGCPVSATRKDFAKYVLQMLKRQEPLIN